MSWQRALTEWYFQFDRLPLIGNFASMGFCVNGMILLAYVSWILRRRKTLLMMIPSAITAAAPRAALASLRRGSSDATDPLLLQAAARGSASAQR